MSRTFRGLLLLLAFVALPTWPAENVGQQIRQVEAALSRIYQEQQAVYQQFHMVQEMRRSEERQMMPLQIYTVPPAPRNYEDVRREQEAWGLRMKQLQYELDQLYARYRELEEQKRPLFDTLAALVQQRTEELSAQRTTPEPREPTTGR